MYMPELVFENVRNIYVEDITVLNSSKEWTKEYGVQISNSIKKDIKNSARGVLVKGYYTQCSWMNTNVYNLVDNAAEADLVISGTLKGMFTKKNNNSENKLTLKEQSIPYFEESFHHSKLAFMEVTIKFTKKDGKCLHTYSDTFKNALDKTFYGKDGYTDSDKSVVAKCVNDCPSIVSNLFLPYLKATKYALKKVKGLKGDDKKLHKTARKLVKKYKCSVAVKMYCDIANSVKKEKSKKVAAKNAGILYLILGDAEKATRYLSMAGEYGYSGYVKNIEDVKAKLLKIGKKL